MDKENKKIELVNLKDGLVLKGRISATSVNSGLIEDKIPYCNQKIQISTGSSNIEVTKKLPNELQAMSFEFGEEVIVYLLPPVVSRGKVTLRVEKIERVSDLLALSNSSSKEIAA